VVSKIPYEQSPASQYCTTQFQAITPAINISYPQIQGWSDRNNLSPIVNQNDPATPQGSCCVCIDLTDVLELNLMYQDLFVKQDAVTFLTVADGAI
jgi:hypothetical protein